MRSRWGSEYVLCITINSYVLRWQMLPIICDIINKITISRYQNSSAIFWNFMSKVSLPKGYRRIISQSHNSPLSLRIYTIKIYLYLVYYTCTYNRSELHSKSFQTPIQPWVLSHSIVGWLYKVKAFLQDDP